MGTAVGDRRRGVAGRGRELPFNTARQHLETEQHLPAYDPILEQQRMLAQQNSSRNRPLTPAVVLENAPTRHGLRCCRRADARARAAVAARCSRTRSSRHSTKLSAGQPIPRRRDAVQHPALRLGHDNNPNGGASRDARYGHAYLLQLAAKRHPADPCPSKAQSQ